MRGSWGDAKAETDDKAELPDVKKEDVKVTAEEGTLTIMGERKFENTFEGITSDGVTTP